MRQVDCIKLFLIKMTHPDLAELYNENMEVQINVAQDNGSRVDRDYKGKQWQEYTDGIQTWKAIRIPYNANSEPEYDLSKEMTYDLAIHAEGIGLTGWNWKNKLSHWVAFDFDALTGHSQRHQKKLTEQELQDITDRVSNIPWVTLRKSTSGKGLHLYIFLDPVTTNNHTEHAALARSILGQLSAICNLDFQVRVDVCGGNLWFWHRKMKGTDGLTILKKGETFYKVPPDWKEHIPVIVGKRQRTLPTKEYSEDSEKERLFEELSGQRIRIKLDDTHYKLLNYLQERNFYCSWNSERWMLITHSWALKEAHRDLSLKGPYDTISEGTDLNTPNIFCFPLRDGAWVVRRYTHGVAEKPTWDQDASGFTRCYFNKSPTLEISAKIHGGMEHSTGAYIFNEAKDLIKAARNLNVNIEVPQKMEFRKSKLRKNSVGKLVVEIERTDQDNASEMLGWIPDKKSWQKVFSHKGISNNDEEDSIKYDDIIRHLISSEDKKDLGWVIKGEEKWHLEPWLHVKTVLEGHYKYDPKVAKNILGSNIIKPWEIVNRPFEHEYLGGRIWNRNAAQLRYPPTSERDRLSFPTWEKILIHCGQSLDYHVSISDWGKQNAILTGADYLKCWIASLFQEPSQPLPYLFFYGPQDCGKSIFHEALSLLVTSGYVRADSTLTSSNNFNGELEGAVICVVEETDMRKDKVAANRIKDWVTAPMLSIHMKHKTPYLIPNTTHWIQTSNEAHACPIFPGDTRITVCFVENLLEEQKIPKKIMFQLLEKEASDFLAAVLSVELPPVTGRLNIPVITTDDKTSVEVSNKNSFELFLDEYCYYTPGECVSYRELYDKFREKLDPNELSRWTIQQMGKSLPTHYPKGKLHGSDPQLKVGNLSFTKTEEKNNKPRLVLRSGYLIPEIYSIKKNGEEEKKNGE